MLALIHVVGIICRNRKYLVVESKYIYSCCVADGHQSVDGVLLRPNDES